MPGLNWAMTASQGAAVNKARALAHAENVLPVVEQIRAGGASLRQIAAELNARGIKTARGGKWYATTVRNILAVENGAEERAALNGGFWPSQSIDNFCKI